MIEIKNNKIGISIFILTLVVVGIGISFAYYLAIVQGTGNTNAEASANTATLGEVEFNGVSTFDSSTFDEIYPGFIGIQTFTVGPYRDGTGIYEIDLEANVPQAFGNDIKITLYKTSNSTSNYITRTEGSLTQGSTGFYKQDTITTTGSLDKVYEGSLVQTDETMLEQVEFAISNNAFTTPDATPDGYYTYYAVYEYINRETLQNSQQNLDFDSKITVKYVTELRDRAIETLQRLQVLNSSLVVTPSTASNPDFKVGAYIEENEFDSGNAEQTSGIFKLSDDYGPSYYFRGDVENNYVKFGKWKSDRYMFFNYDNNSFSTFSSLDDIEYPEYYSLYEYANEGDDMYWRIIRINGDGSIRMIYDGTRAYENDELRSDYDNPASYSTIIRCIGDTYFNDVQSSEDYGDNAFNGYMYGTPGSDNYNDTHANIHDSTIKEYVDEWYEENFLNTSYESFIADALFCNDRSLASADELTNFNQYYSDHLTLNGYGKSDTLYSFGERLFEQFDLKLGNRSTFKCPQKHDAFTAIDTVHGNGSLKYPVGLITIDEANIAGGDMDNWNQYYLVVGEGFWIYGGGLDYEGHLSYGYWSDYAGVRPVINLKPTSITSGDGTANNPFTIE